MGLIWAAMAFAPPSAAAREESGEDIYAIDDREYGLILGVVMDDQGWRIVVNETSRVRISSDTEILDARERKARRSAVRTGRWVYAEGPITFDGDVEADRVYLMPGPVAPGEYGKYPFIKMAPIPGRR